MKQGWTYKKLGEVCEVISGQSPESQYYNKEGNGLPFYQGKKEFTEKYIGSPTTWTTEITKIAEKGDLLMSVRAPVGDVNFATKQLCIGRGLAAIRIKSDVDKDYLFYYLLANKNKIKGKEGVGFSSINRSEIKEINLQYPSEKSEQKRIVSRLDSAFAHIDALKANAEKQLDDAKALFEKALEKAMEPKEGWEEKTIEYFAKIIHGKNQKEVLDDNGLYPIYGSGGNIMGYANSYLCDEGTTILGRKGTIDNPMYIEEKFWNVDTAFGIIAKDNCNKKFLFYSIKKIDWAKHNTGTTLPSLTQNVVYNIEMCAPSLSEQQKIVSRLDSLSKNVKKLQEIQDKTIKECDALKQAMLRQVFE